MSIESEYHDWLKSIVCCGKLLNHNKLMRRLYDTDFRWTNRMDANRAYDGVNLRYEFGDQYNIPYPEIAYYLDDRPCSVFEMMVALAIRCEKDIMFDLEQGDRTSKWFEVMIHCMGLDDMDDSHFDIEYADIRINHCLDHIYSKDGRGGFFYVPHSTIDMRTIDIWYQMQEFLNHI